MFSNNNFNTIKNNKIKNVFFSKEKSAMSLTENNILLSLKNKESKKNQKDFLPNISFLFKDDKLNDNGDEVVDNNNIGNERNEKLKKLLVQKKDLYNLYKLLDNKKIDFKDNYPTRSVKSYFEKYTKKNIPILNVENGSNIII